MWVPWVKKSSTPKHTKSPSFTIFSFDDNPPSSPIHHHSPSLKDIHTLLHQHPIPSSPLHKHSLSLPFSPARTPARSPTHLSASASFKDVQYLFEAQSRKPSVLNRPPSSSTNLRRLQNRQINPKGVQSQDGRTRFSHGWNLHRRVTEDYSRKNRERNDEFTTKSIHKWEAHRRVEEIRRLQESGELKKMIQGLEMAEEGVCRRNEDDRDFKVVAQTAIASEIIIV
ncbi:hypothetical protein RDABS01_006408 [Bienertia sinuspersici]